MLKKSSMGLSNTTGKKAKPSPVGLADATKTPHKKPAKVISVTNAKKRESKVQPTSPSMMTPGNGSTSPIPPIHHHHRHHQPNLLLKTLIPFPRQKDLYLS